MIDMFCGRCGNKLKENDIFCTSCGARVIKEESAAPYAEAPAFKAVQGTEDFASPIENAENIEAYNQNLENNIPSEEAASSDTLSDVNSESEANGPYSANNQDFSSDVYQNSQDANNMGGNNSQNNTNNPNNPNNQNGAPAFKAKPRERAYFGKGALVFCSIVIFVLAVVCGVFAGLYFSEKGYFKTGKGGKNAEILPYMQQITEENGEYSEYSEYNEFFGAGSNG